MVFRMISAWAMPVVATPSAPLVTMAARIGLPATTSCEPRQARKGAAAAVASGAGVRPVRVATLLKIKSEQPTVKGQGIRACPLHRSGASITPP